jgi:tRNA dimethylallyltransferase
MKTPQGRILVLVGPTASGKTSLSIELARILNAEIISADSRQVYRYLDIGTAKPTKGELAEVPHHFVDILPPDAGFSAGLFGVQARAVVEQIFSRGRIPLVVGGSGLYVKSLIDGLFSGPGADPDLRATLEDRMRSEGAAGLLEDLQRLDPESAARIDPTKPRRIVRALEVCLLTGRPMSELHRTEMPVIPFEAVQVGLLWERALLNGRIDARCDGMLEAGLMEEVDRLAGLGYDRRLSALNTVGYAEGFACRAGEIGRTEMVRLFKRNTRRYAKRQMTWFRSDSRIKWTTMPGEGSAGRIASLFFGRLP